jgi:serine/threonine-protein kinase RsbT
MQGLNVSHEPQRSSRVKEPEVSSVGAKFHDWSSDRHDFAPAAVRVPITNHADIVIARQEGRAVAETMKFSATDSAFIATTVSELARALLSVTTFGEICLYKIHEGDRSGLLIVMRVPIPYDGAQAGRYAVAADLALPDVRRLVDEFDIAADGNDGTTIRATKWCRRR